MLFYKFLFDVSDDGKVCESSEVRCNYFYGKEEKLRAFSWRNRGCRIVFARGNDFLSSLILDTVTFFDNDSKLQEQLFPTGKLVFLFPELLLLWVTVSVT